MHAHLLPSSAWQVAGLFMPCPPAQTSAPTLSPLSLSRSTHLHSMLTSVLTAALAALANSADLAAPAAPAAPAATPIPLHLPAPRSAATACQARPALGRQRQQQQQQRRGALVIRSAMFDSLSRSIEKAQRLIGEREREGGGEGLGEAVGGSGRRGEGEGG